MASTHTATADSREAGLAGRLSILAYSLLSYALSMAALLWLVASLAGLVPFGTGPVSTASTAAAVGVNAALLVLFGLQHSIMARKGFKDWWTRSVPPPAERGTYVLTSGAALALAVWLWQPMDAVVWNVSGPALQTGLWVLFAAGWLYLVAATFVTPAAAMRNIKAALKPGGELLFSVWRPIEDNPWLGVAKQVVLDHVPPPGEDAQTCGPGPFSMANPDVVRQELKIAGLEPVDFERIDGPVTVGDSAEAAMRFQLALGPAGETFREAGDLAEQRREEIEQALRRELAPYEQDGQIVMPSSSWSITARKPG